MASSASLSNDPKYKSYVANVDKALKNFEYTSEWADLVNALSKLNRVFANNSRYRSIPRRFIVGQRLAQCMHPLLPSGVHLKALETYDLIFNCIGSENLLSELTVYSNGLFPLLSYAAINVRPALLDLYERHIIPIGDRLKPALDGFIIGVLPGLEEGSDFADRTDKLLLKISMNVGQEYFYSSLWRCIMKNSSIRLHAISFVIVHFNKKKSLSEQSYIFGYCMQTLVQAVCAALLDTNILVQRAILDMLLNCFPLHLNLSNEMKQTMASPSHQASSKSIQSDPNTAKSPSKQASDTSSTGSQQRQYFKKIELVAIITAALTVLLRRDLSLNRRLSAWFFGNDSSPGSASGSSGASNSQSQSTFKSSNQNSNSTSGTNSNSSENKARRKRLVYFDNYARELVLEAFKRCITVITTRVYDSMLIMFLVLEPNICYYIDPSCYCNNQFIHFFYAALHKRFRSFCFDHFVAIHVDHLVDALPVRPSSTLVECCRCGREYSSCANCSPQLSSTNELVRCSLQFYVKFLAISIVELHSGPTWYCNANSGHALRRHITVSLVQLFWRLINVFIMFQWSIPWIWVAQQFDTATGCQCGINKALCPLWSPH